MMLRFGDNLYLLDLPQNVEGFRRFIGSWVLKEDDSALLVDVGPANTIRLLERGLRELGINRVEYVLLTHIHLDHAGGIGHLIELHPEVKVVVHERGAGHLINPARLWAASRKVLGELALIYGEIKPVPPGSIYSGKIEFGGLDVEILPTPGHAPHHQSYVIGDYLFTGDSAGVFIGGEKPYLRPSTPPKFVKELYVDSLEKMLRPGRKRVCFAHFGMHDNSQEIIRKHRNRIELWVEVMRDAMQTAGSMEEAVEAAWRELLEVDELLSGYYSLERGVQERERRGARTSLIGIYRYLRGVS
ncbi:MBL fold metallo-hydrolase [Thermococcus sp.]